mmetsp:Transcript_18582/g.17668  ORF Transcript_18582/g.17668 Transcript_18582/m.17668 type:complete len:96 (+) Transcript_18582:116-403(+)
MEDKLSMDELRHHAMVDERRFLSQNRIQTLIKSEIQREQIKNALYSMSVWNTFQPKVINHILLLSGKSSDITIDELVRKTALSAKGKRRSVDKSP